MKFLWGLVSTPFVWAYEIVRWLILLLLAIAQLGSGLLLGVGLWYYLTYVQQQLYWGIAAGAILAYVVYYTLAQLSKKYPPLFGWMDEYFR